MAIASLVLSIVGIVLTFLLPGGPIVGPIVGLILGIIAVVLGSKAKKVAPSGMATAGKVIGIIAIIVSAIFLVVAVACAGAIVGLAAMAA